MTRMTAWLPRPFSQARGPAVKSWRRCSGLPRTRAHAQAAQRVTTVLGTGVPGRSERHVNNPYGLAFGPDESMYFCDLDTHRVRRLDLRAGRTSVVAGNGRRGYTGDGGLATAASLDMPHEVQCDRHGTLYIVERESHVVRKVDGRGIISTLAGTGTAGYAGDEGPAAAAQLRSPHSVALDPTQRFLLVCDTGNHRLRRIDLASGRIQSIGGTGDRRPTLHGVPLKGTPLAGPRAVAYDAAGVPYLALREGNSVFRIDGGAGTLHHVAGTGEAGYGGDGGPARQARLDGPKGLAWWNGTLYIADTENHVIRAVSLDSGMIRTVLGTGLRGDGPEPDPGRCALARPHGIAVDAAGALYVGDSEAHRIRVLE